jgi:hypothetical protein
MKRLLMSIGLCLLASFVPSVSTALDGGSPATSQIILDQTPASREITPAISCELVLQGNEKWWECGGVRVTQIANTSYGEEINGFRVVGGWAVWEYRERVGLWLEGAYYARSVGGGLSQIRTITQTEENFGQDRLREFTFPSGSRLKRATWRFYDSITGREDYFYRCIDSLWGPHNITETYAGLNAISFFSVSGDTATWVYNGQDDSKALGTCEPQPLVLEFEPTDDAFTRQNKPNQNNCCDHNLRFRNLWLYHTHSYLKFNVSGIPAGRDVTSAKLRVRSRGNFIPDFSVWYVTDQAFSNSWQEETLTWNNSTTEAQFIQVKYNIQPYTWVEMDVTSVVTGNGIYTLGLATSVDQTGLGVSSKEVNGQEPVLIITVD